MSIAFTDYYNELNLVMNEAHRLLLSAKPAEMELHRNKLDEARARVEREVPLRIAFVGQFSAGKSSLISALTGADVKIDADVCTTETSEYQWRGLTLVDTPGIQAEGGETDHDKIAREATVGVDLVLFVITNELFNPRLAKHLRFILDEEGLGLGKKTALVVNKVDRDSNTEEIRRSEIQKVLGPHQTVPIYFCAASKYLQAANAPADLADRFLKQSRIPALIEGINQFVDDAGTLGRLTAPIQVVGATLEALQASLITPESDKLRLEMIRRQRVELQKLQNRLLLLRKTQKQEVYSIVLKHAEPTINQINEVTSNEDIECLFHQGMMEAAGPLESVYATTACEVTAAWNETGDLLNKLGESPLAQKIAKAADNLTSAGANFEGERPSNGKCTAKIVRAVSDPTEKVLRHAAQNSKEMRDIVYKIGKAFGKKFAPHEATNAGKTISDYAGKLTRAFPYLMTMLNFYIQFREEKDQIEREQYLSQIRIGLRNAFADQAKKEADELEARIIDATASPVANALTALDDAAADLAAKETETRMLTDEIQALMRRCTRLRNMIIGGVDIQTEPAKETIDG